MRHIVGSVLVLVTVAFLGGCAGGKAAGAKAPAAPHLSVAMDDETSRALLGDDDTAVGTTTLTSATFVLARPATVIASPPGVKPQPEELVGDEEPEAAPIRTWGAPPSDVDGIPTNRE